jgi:hypothetical protein
VDGIDKDKTQIVQTLEKSTKDGLLMEQRMQLQEQVARDTTNALKRLTDSQRELEDIIARRAAK